MRPSKRPLARLLEVTPEAQFGTRWVEGKLGFFQSLYTTGGQHRDLSECEEKECESLWLSVLTVMCNWHELLQRFKFCYSGCDIRVGKRTA